MYKLNLISIIKSFKSLSIFPKYHHSIKFRSYYMYLNDDYYNIIIHDKIDSDNYGEVLGGQLSLNKNKILKRTLEKKSKTNTIQYINKRRFIK